MSAELSRCPLCAHVLDYVSLDKSIFGHNNEQINKGQHQRASDGFSKDTLPFLDIFSNLKHMPLTLSYPYLTLT